MDTGISEMLRRQNQSWFMRKLEELSDEARLRAAMGDTAKSTKRNITLPLNIDDYYILDQIATTLGMSKTAVAVNMLADALVKAYSMIEPEDETPDIFWERVIAYAEKSDVK